MVYESVKGKADPQAGWQQTQALPTSLSLGRKNWGRETKIEPTKNQKRSWIQIILEGLSEEKDYRLEMSSMAGTRELVDQGDR